MSRFRTRSRSRKSSEEAVARSLGYNPRKVIDDGYEEIKFDSKRDKWNYLLKTGGSDVYLYVKDVFGDVGEPKVRRKKEEKKE